MKHRSAKSALAKLKTEQQNPATMNLDDLSALEIARAINREDQRVALAVEKALPEIAHAMDLVAESLRKGGRLIYVGAGTSGRLGALDASEIPPTFGIDPKLVRYVIAGGDKALHSAVEDEEDSTNLGKKDMAKLKPGKRDVVIGIAASGRTPYTLAALRYAKKKGTKTIAVVCNRHSPIEHAAGLAIVIDVGPEVLSGSTRMKAGTAQKLVLNMISTGAMVRLGYVYGNSDGERAAAQQETARAERYHPPKSSRHKPQRRIESAESRRMEAPSRIGDAEDIRFEGPGREEPQDCRWKGPKGDPVSSECSPVGF